MVNSAKRILDGAGITATRFLTGSYVTALDMAGASVTVSMLDGKAKALWDAPVHTAALRWGACISAFSRRPKGSMSLTCRLPALAATTAIASEHQTDKCVRNGRLHFSSSRKARPLLPAGWLGLSLNLLCRVAAEAQAEKAKF